MTTSLMDRFTYGNAWGVNPQEEVYREITQKCPARQRAMIALAKQQIKEQQIATHQIAQSNIIGAQMVATEIQQQTRVLENSVQQVGATVAQEMSSAADQISYAVDALGNQISIELAEIQWQIAQENKTLEQILHVLHENRNNEARQLVQQGIRLYINEQYQKAEERFKRALDCDMTDYQVLMNLAYIEIHKNNAKAAYGFFNDALKLPQNLDALSQSRTLWAITRLFYTTKNYEKAFQYAEQSLKIGRREANGIFMTAIYATLSGRKNGCPETS